MKKQTRPLIIGIKGNKQNISVNGITPQMVTEDSLNQAKNGLDKYYQSEEKLSLTQKIVTSMDVYRGILRDAKRKYNAQFPSNAWSKYIEIYELVSKLIGSNVINAVPGKTFNVFCNAELPGSSISALNHLFKTKYVSSPLNWIASSYRPNEDGTQLGDHYGIYEMNKDRWLISNPDFDGDMTKGEIVKQCIDLYLSRVPNGCDLYSHDAGIDVTKDFGKWKAYRDQEAMNTRLHLGCAIAGLGTLALGGSFIAKQYTLYRTVNIRLLGIYIQFFNQFYLVKPMTSRPVNSESYLLGIGYKKPDNYHELMQELYRLIDLDTLEDDDTKDSYYYDVAEKVGVYMDYSAGRQLVMLGQVTSALEKSEVKDSNNYIADVNYWFKLVGLMPIDPKDHLPSNASIGKTH